MCLSPTDELVVSDEEDGPPIETVQVGHPTQPRQDRPVTRRREEHRAAASTIHH